MTNDSRNPVPPNPARVPASGGLGADWIYKFGREMSQLQGAFTVTPPRIVTVTLAAAPVLLISGNPQRFAVVFQLPFDDDMKLWWGQGGDDSNGFLLKVAATIEHWNIRQVGGIVQQPWYGHPMGPQSSFCVSEVIMND